MKTRLFELLTMTCTIPCPLPRFQLPPLAPAYRTGRTTPPNILYCNQPCSLNDSVRCNLSRLLAVVSCIDCLNNRVQHHNRRSNDNTRDTQHLRRCCLFNIHSDSSHWLNMILQATIDDITSILVVNMLNFRKILADIHKEVNKSIQYEC